MKTDRLKLPELLAPAGNWECAKAAVENGADAIYFGLEKFNARMRSQNFSTGDLPELMAFLHGRGVKGYVTFNTLIFPQELTEAEQFLRSLISAGVDAAIVQDLGICRLIRHLSPDFPIHASTQMTITSAAGVKFAQNLGCQLVVLARECTLKEIHKIRQQTDLPLEVFVHGALCVAYSGQCLTSESLGGRSANRGECAQACRMTYELIVDGKKVDLGDRQYLLSPQDLSGLTVLPDLVAAGVSCLKIEGRLKAPEYVANVTKVYRQALDRLSAAAFALQPQDQYNLEMAFSRGLYTGWFQGINNQELVHGRFGKKRGVYLGEVVEVRRDRITVELQNLQNRPKPGDGVVFDAGHPEAKEQGGRIYTVDLFGDRVILSFGKESLNFQKINLGDRIWKTSDPELEKTVRQSYASEQPQFQRPLRIEIHGAIGAHLVAIAMDESGHLSQVESAMPLIAAHSKPMTTETLRAQFGRLGNTPFDLGELHNHLEGEVMLPIAELNRIRRELVENLTIMRSQPKVWHLNSTAKLTDLMPHIAPSPSLLAPQLIVLVRNFHQLEAVMAADLTTIYCDFEAPRAYAQAVQNVRDRAVPECQIFVAPPRITKPHEQWILQQVKAAGADGYLIRNYDHLEFFADCLADCIGDFSLNVANPLTADYLIKFSLQRLTASYDLNVNQLRDLLVTTPASWWEITIHQHMPMFHMEHCVFCAFLSTGTDYSNCGRPCDRYEVKLRDRVGVEHLLKADAGCRNTVFNGTAQTGAEYVQRFIDLGVRHFRIEFTNESSRQVNQTIRSYQQLLAAEITGGQLWRTLKTMSHELQNQLGVTRGSNI